MRPPKVCRFFRAGCHRGAAGRGPRGVAINNVENVKLLRLTLFVSVEVYSIPGYYSATPCNDARRTMESNTMPRPSNRTGLAAFVEVFANPHVKAEDLPDASRNLVGTSLSKCLAEIIIGAVDESRVSFIVTSTKHPWSDDYIDGKWYKDEAEVLKRLWKGGRIHQPRAVSTEYDNGEWGTVTTVPYPTMETEAVAPLWFALVPYVEN